MKFGLYSGLIAGTMALAAAPGYAATVMLTIDEFDSVQTVKDVPSTSFVNNSEVADAGVLGGYRDFEVMNTDATGNPEDATELRSEAGLLSFSNIAGASGSGYITYDGQDDPTSVNTTGLGGINLEIGTNPYFAFDVAYFDRNVFIEITAWDMLGNVVSYSETLAAGFNPNLPFSDLIGDPNFDWTQVGALQFFVDSSNTEISVDGQLNSIKVVADMNVIPLPASGLLLLGGISSAGFLLRRKRRKSS
ncbi:hypothetical protein GI582_03405 [Sulfitobacter sp. BDSS02]|nr:hypothetical protein [Sulfitobacter sp. BDSS02]MBR9851158.1 hypothetical protein [Paracoccaceae bacterium]